MVDFPLLCRLFLFKLSQRHHNRPVYLGRKSTSSLLCFACCAAAPPYLLFDAPLDCIILEQPHFLRKTTLHFATTKMENVVNNLHPRKPTWNLNFFSLRTGETSTNLQFLGFHEFQPLAVQATSAVNQNPCDIPLVILVA